MFICSDRQGEGGQLVDLCIGQTVGEGEGEPEARRPPKAVGAGGSSGPSQETSKKGRAAP